MTPVFRNDPLRAVLIDESPLEIVRLASLLERIHAVAVVGFASDTSRALDRLDELAPDVAVIDVHVDSSDRGLGLLDKVRIRHPRLRVAAVTQFGGHAAHGILCSAGASACFKRSAGILPVRDWLVAEAEQRMVETG